MQANSHSYDSLRILSQSEHGYVGQCNCCGQYNFAFGNLLFIFTVDGLTGFQSMLYEIQQFHQLETCLPNDKTYIVPSPIPNFMLSFSEEEMEEMKNLFQETFLTLEIDKIFARND